MFQNPLVGALILVAILLGGTTTVRCESARFSAGDSHSVAVDVHGRLWAWGANWYGQIGNGLGGDGSDGHNAVTPTQVAPDDLWQSAAAGGFHCLAIQRNGTLWSWGANWFGQLGNGEQGEALFDLAANQPAPVQIGVDSDWIAIAAGAFHSVALKSDGSLWAWGRNEFGQVGDGSGGSGSDDATRNIPVQIGSQNSWTQIGAGENYCLALDIDGKLYGWGRNHIGQLGDGTRVLKTAPTQLTDTIGWRVLGGSGNFDGGHLLLIDSEGLLWASGNNFNGQVGDGTSEFSGHQFDTHTMKRIGADNGVAWIDVAGGGWFSVGVQSDGTLWGWGRNANGELGFSGPHANAPTPADAGTDWVNVAAGYRHALGLKSDGSLWGWGFNFFGQVGTGESGQNALEYVPVKILELGIASPAAPRFSRITLRAGGGCELELQAVPGSDVTIETSTDLNTWETAIALPVPAAGLVIWIDRSARAPLSRFYRAR